MLQLIKVERYQQLRQVRITSLHLSDQLAIEMYGPGLLAGINKIVHPTFHRDRQLTMKRKYLSNEFYLVWMQSKNEIMFVSL